MSTISSFDGLASGAPPRNRRASLAPRVPRRNGFTVIELLVVLAILALGTVMLAPALFQSTETVTFMADARSFGAALKEARTTAIMESREVVVYLNVDDRTYRIGEDGDSGSFADDVHIVLKTARSEQLTETQGGIRFFPTGSSTGGKVTFERGNKAVTVAINWVTGDVSSSR